MASHGQIRVKLGNYKKLSCCRGSTVIHVTEKFPKLLKTMQNYTVH